MLTLQRAVHTQFKTHMTAKIILQDGKWIGMVNGAKVTSSYDQTRTIKMMAKAGYPNAVIEGQDVREEVEEIDDRWPINQRFEFVSSLVGMVARREATSAIITGPGGLGKTHTVLEALNAAGLKDAGDPEVQAGLDTFKMIKGYTTPKALYRQLYENAEGLLVFDDCDSVMKDDNALNLLKGALDTYEKRVISWNSEGRPGDDDLPMSFRFFGRVIFISNRPRSKIAEPLLTRAYCVDLAMTLEQKLERMTVMLNNPQFLPHFDHSHKEEALELIRSVADRAREVSLRTLESTTRIRASNAANWRALAEYALTN